MSTGVAKKKPISDGTELSGRQKVAIVLMAAGEEATSEITGSLSPEEVEANSRARSARLRIAERID